MELIHTCPLFAVIAIIAFNAMLYMETFRNQTIVFALYSLIVNVVETYAVVTMNANVLITVLLVGNFIGRICPPSLVFHNPFIVTRMTMPVKLKGVFLNVIIVGIQYGAVAWLSGFPL